MITEITITEQWYESLIEDLRDIIVETEFASRWALVEGYHSLGSRILQEYENFQRLRMPDQELIATVATSLNKRPRTIYYAVQFARLYPDLNLLPEGKDASWHRIVNKYLTDGKDQPTITKSDLIRMIAEIKKLLETEYLKAHQIEITLTPASFHYDSNKAIIKFIRYLQDQVNKITGEL